MKLQNLFLVAFISLLISNNSIFSQSSEKLLRKAEKARINADYQMAHDLLTQAIRTDPNNWRAYKERSEIFEFLRKPDSALLDNYNYAKISGGSKKLWYDLFNEFLEKQDIVMLEDCAFQFYRFDSSAIGENIIGIAYYTMGDYYKGIYYFDKAINKDDTSSIYYYNMAKCNFALNSIEKAEEYYNISKSLNPYTGIVYIGLGSCEYQKGNFEIAIKLLNEGLFYSDANKSQGFYYRGLSYIHLNMITQGCQDLKDAIDLGNKQATDFYEIHCK